MKLYVLESSTRKILAVAEENSSGGVNCPVTDFLANQPKERSGAAKGFKMLFKRYAEKGRNGLTASLFHEVDKNEKIWEFIKGGLRVYCFFDNDEKLVILSHGAVKKGQKVDQKEVKRAKSMKKKYLDSKSKSTITMEKINDNEY